MTKRLKLKKNKMTCEYLVKRMTVNPYFPKPPSTFYFIRWSLSSLHYCTSVHQYLTTATWKVYTISRYPLLRLLDTFRKIQYDSQTWKTGVIFVTPSDFLIFLSFRIKHTTNQEITHTHSLTSPVSTQSCSLDIMIDPPSMTLDFYLFPLSVFFLNPSSWLSWVTF